MVIKAINHVTHVYLLCQTACVARHHTPCRYNAFQARDS